MTDYRIILGNRRYSSWSLRGWLVLRLTGVAFEEIVIPLYRPESKAAILAHAPSGLVPALEADGIAIWDSLAIAEFLHERFPDAEEVLQIWPDEALDPGTLDANAHVVTLTHDPKFDLPVLAQALRSEAGYIGALGSRTTHRRRLTRLREQGFDPAQLARIRTPVGLDIGARTPEEIALSILAEMVAARRGRDGRPLVERRGPIHGDA